MADGWSGTGKNDLGQDVSEFEAPELSQEDYTQHSAGVLANALESTRLVQVVETQANSVNQVHLQCRVKDKDAKSVAWTIIKPLLYLEAQREDFSFFFGKQYLLKEGNMVFAWVFSFASPRIVDLAREVAHIVDDNSDAPKMEVVETPLVGPGTPQSSGQGSKGARPIGG